MMRLRISRLLIAGVGGAASRISYSDSNRCDTSSNSSISSDKNVGSGVAADSKESHGRKEILPIAPTTLTSFSSVSTWDSNWDLRAGQVNPNKVVHQIVLIRHGQYVNADDDEECILTPLGREQAHETGIRIGQLVDAGHILPIKSLYYSTMTRATQTGLCIVDELGRSQAKERIATSDWIRYYSQEGYPYLSNISSGESKWLDPFNGAGLSFSISPCSMIREGAVCRPDPPNTNWTPSDESFRNAQARIEAGFLHYFHRAVVKAEASYSTVLVCHGNVIRYFVMRALQLPPSAWLRTAVYNSSITIVEISASGQVSLRCMGDVGHLAPEKISYS